MENEITKSNIESIDGEHITQNEYILNQIARRHEDQMRWVAEREAAMRQHKTDADLAKIKIRLKQSMLFANAIHGADLKKPKRLNINWIGMLAFWALIFGVAATIKQAFYG